MNKTLPMSERMLAVADMVTRGNRVCDVGCDHGYVSIYLVEQGISPMALAMDINKGPLALADKNIRERGLHNKIATRLSDGITEYTKDEADTLLIAGMGGPLICSILSKDRELTHSFKELVLSPQSEIMETRIFLSQEGYRIVDENMVYEDDKYYAIIKCVHTDCTADTDATKQLQLSKAQAKFGPVLIAKRHPVLEQYLIHERTKTDNVLCKLKRQLEIADENSEERIKARIEELSKEAEMVKQTLTQWGE